MASLKEIKTRINSVKSTRKITSAMKMVASAKLHKAQAVISNMMPYQEVMNTIMGNLLNGETGINSPLFTQRQVNRVAIVAFSSNSSLCGAFNANVIKTLAKAIQDISTLGQTALLFPIGTKVTQAAKRTVCQTLPTPSSLSVNPNYHAAETLAQQLIELYLNGEIDKVELIYHNFKSTGVQRLIRETYLPLNAGSFTLPNHDTKHINAYIVEPSPQLFAERFIPTVLTQRILTAAAHSIASEHAARTIAMQTATDNADDLIQELTRQYNKTRQQAITSELQDIVSGTMA